MLLDIILTLVNIVILFLMIWLCAQFLLAVPKGIFFAFKKVKGLIGKLFKKIAQTIEVKNKFGLYAGRIFLIVFPIWLGIEIGGDWYSFSEVLWGGLWILLGVAVIVKLAFPSE